MALDYYLYYHVYYKILRAKVIRHKRRVLITKRVQRSYEMGCPENCFFFSAINFGLYVHLLLFILRLDGFGWVGLGC